MLGHGVPGDPGLLNPKLHGAIKLFKERFAQHYTRKPWLKLVGIAAVLLISFVLALSYSLGWGNSAAYKEGYNHGTQFAAEMLRTRGFGESPSELLNSLKNIESDEAVTGFAATPYPRGSTKSKAWMRGYEDAIEAASRSAK